MSLPPLDEHAVDIDAPPAAVWAALLDWCAATFDRAPARGIARVLACADTSPSGPRPVDVGSVVAGFHVTEAAPGSVLRLAGHHRFSTYELTFRLTGSTTLTAESRADFPGLAGGAYRAMLLGSRGHVLSVRKMLGDVKRRAE